ncbi:MAG: hypothetical protein K2J08_07305 [Ruminococcus sp.]|nr:hypothetical protein [Ruminococcus sp.]
MAGEAKRTVRSIFAVIFIIIGIVFGVGSVGTFCYRQTLVSQKAEVEEDEMTFIVKIGSDYMEREEFFEYIDQEIKEATTFLFVPLGMTVIFIGLAANNISKNKKEKNAGQ